jgi:hypothetical protein
MMFAPIPNQQWYQPKAHPLGSVPLLLGEMFRGLASSSIDQSIIASQLIAHASLVAQGVADVAWPNGLTAPIGLSVILVAPSGTGKSLVSRLLVTPIHLHLRECARQLKTGQLLPEYFIEDANRPAVIEHLVAAAVNLVVA